MITIGDWSGDGHGQCVNYMLLSNVPLSIVQMAYDRSRKKYKILDPHTFCYRYQDSVVPKGVVAAMLSHGIDLKRWCDCDGDDDDDSESAVYMNSEAMVKFIIEFIRLSDDAIELFPQKDPPRLETGGFVGYGLFSS
jgi:hypothetical protein